MTDTNADVQETPEVEDYQEGPEQQYSEAEIRAMEQGWKPQEEWEGDPDEWVSAAEFNRRGQLFGKINSQKQELREMRNAMKRMHEMMVANNENAYKNALAELKAQRQQALENGDTDLVLQLDNQVDYTTQAMKQTTQEMRKSFQAPEEVPEFFQEWKENNAWYGSDKKKTALADAVAAELVQQYQQQGKQIDREQLLNEVAKEVRTTFGNTNNATKLKNKSPDVMGSRPPSNASRGKGISSLEPFEQQIARTIIQTTGMTEQEYMKQYREAK